MQENEEYVEIIVNNKVIDIYRKAIGKWGVQTQLNMVAEECCELAKAVLKLNRKKNNSTTDDVIDEMADVYLMLGQLEVMLRYSFCIPDVNDKINRAFDRKMIRLDNLIRV